MSESPVAKIEKAEEFECEICSKTFDSEATYQTHLKMKHPKNTKPDNKQKADISPPNKAPSKSKGGFEQYQQDLEDKIFAFLGELGEKNVISSDDLENNGEESDKMIGQSNYLENTIVKTPYEAEFDVIKIMNEVELPAAVLPAELNEVFKRDTTVMWEKLSAERQTWEFCDPIELYKYENEEFTLVNVPSVIRNYRKKGITVDYPELVIFALWLTKTCKSAAWKQLYTVLVYTTAQYFEHRDKNGVAKDKSAWKNFNLEYLARLEKDFPKALSDQLNILKAEDVVSFLKLYSKWVSYFGLQ